MRDITLKKFFKDKYTGTQREFSKMVGIHESIISKFKNGKESCTADREAWMKLCAYIKNNYHLILVSVNKSDIQQDEDQAEIRDLKLEIERLKQVNKEQNKTIKTLRSCVRILSKVDKALKESEEVYLKNLIEINKEEK